MLQRTDGRQFLELSLLWVWGYFGTIWYYLVLFWYYLDYLVLFGTIWYYFVLFWYYEPSKTERDDLAVQRRCWGKCSSRFLPALPLSLALAPSHSFHLKWLGFEAINKE